MSYFDQAEFADNPEPRCPVVLCLDTSGSMKGDPIVQLNEALAQFSAELKDDSLASLRVEVAVVTFGGGVKSLGVHADDSGEDAGFDPAKSFTTVDLFAPPELKAGGGTPMGEAVRKSLELLRARKEVYKNNDLDYFRPWMFLITDGKPTDNWESAAEQARLEDARKGLLFFGIGVESAEMETLAKFSPENRPPMKLRGLAFSELFQWLSRSLSAVAHSKVGDQIPLPPVGWAEVDTSS
jgi:uncharacterized protein YegL